MKKVYEAVLHIDPLQKEGTANYTCRKTFANTPQSSVYIYAVGTCEDVEYSNFKFSCI